MLPGKLSTAKSLKLPALGPPIIVGAQITVSAKKCAQ